MYKAATINARIEPALKTRAETILNRVGLTSAEAIRIFYKQICLKRGIPFDVSIPNAKTQQAMKDAEAGKTHKVKSVDALFEELAS